MLIAAYNEEKVIAETLRTVLATDYKGEMEVIVVDDGSRDQTPAEVEAVAATDPRVRLGAPGKPAGKRALSSAVWRRSERTLSCSSMPTHIVSATRSVTWFNRSRMQQIGAVSGHAKVGNLRTFIARCQALEYTCGFNLDRRAYTRWNCMTVVPGAISAMRKTAIDDAGGLSLETLAEDTDLTLALHKTRQQIVYVPGGDCLDGSARDGSHTRAAAISLGLRHAAMSLETSRHGLQLEISRARLVQPAECLVFPDHSRCHHADG